MSRVKGWFQIDDYTNRARGISNLDVRYGANRVSEIGAYARERGLRRAMLVTGPHVSKNSAVIGPLRDSLGDLLAGEFFETSRGKQISTVFEGINRMRQVGADLLIGVGGGGSLDTARQISAFAADGRPMAFFEDAARAAEFPGLEGAGSAEVILVPTTLAGADLSTGGSVELLPGAESPDGRPRRMNPQNVAPVAVFYDPRLYESSPQGVLAGSAMNGFNKGIETLYSPFANPYSDALSLHGLSLMGKGLLALSSDARSGLEKAVAGVILIQLQLQISILHAFGHAVARNSSVQQGIAHAVLAPHVLRFLLSIVDLHREKLASALQAAGAVAVTTDPAEAVLEGTLAVRDGLGLPSSFGDVKLAHSIDLQACAEHVCANSLMAGAPLARSITVEEAMSVLEAAS